MALINIGDSETYGYTGAMETIDVSDVWEVSIAFQGAGGGGGVHSLSGTSGWTGGSGGYAEFTVDVELLDTLEIYVGQGGSNGSPAGDGYFNGGLAGDSSWAGCGGGSGRLQLPSGTFLAAVDAGGGAGGYQDSTSESFGGGGGARGGLGGSGDFNGESGNGTGFGGDGGNGGSSAQDGGDGGQEVDDTHTRIVSVAAETAGGGGSGGFESASGDNGQATVTVTEEANPPAAPSGLSVSSFNDSEISLTWTDNATHEEEYRVYRDTSSNVSLINDNLVATLAVDATSYTDTGLNNGREYHHVVTAWNRHGESASSEVATTTDLPDVSGLSLTTSREG